MSAQHCRLPAWASVGEELAESEPEAEPQAALHDVPVIARLILHHADVIRSISTSVGHLHREQNAVVEDVRSINDWNERILESNQQALDSNKDAVDKIEEIPKQNSEFKVVLGKMKLWIMGLLALVVLAISVSVAAVLEMRNLGRFAGSQFQ